jgi:hypothetical protein
MMHLDWLPDGAEADARWHCCGAAADVQLHYGVQDGYRALLFTRVSTQTCWGRRGM